MNIRLSTFPKVNRLHGDNYFIQTLCNGYGCVLCNFQTCSSLKKFFITDKININDFYFWLIVLHKVQSLSIIIQKSVQHQEHVKQFLSMGHVMTTVVGVIYLKYFNNKTDDLHCATDFA